MMWIWSKVFCRLQNIVVGHPPVCLSMAESCLEWANRQSHFLLASSSRPHWAQWNPGSNGRSHRVLPSVPSTAMKNTHGDGRPEEIQRSCKFKCSTHTHTPSLPLGTPYCVIKCEEHVIPAPVHVLFWLPAEPLRTKRISFTLSLFVSSVAKKS